MKDRTKKKKVWEKLLFLDIVCIMVFVGSFCYHGWEKQTKETGIITKTVQNTVQGDSGKEPEGTRESMETEKKKIALTFDDGPHPVYTPQMLDGLKEKNVKATFFLLGQQVEKYPDIVKRMSDEGHLIGNHSYKHEQLSKLSSVQACSQVNRTNELIQSITGEYPEYLRPPFGDWKDDLDCQVNMIEVLWDLDTLDWSSKNKSKIINKVVTNVEEGDIILMHDSYESTVSATMELIDILQKEGYEFVTVDELILE